jgi:hypothetical protein
MRVTSAQPACVVQETAASAMLCQIDHKTARFHPVKEVFKFAKGRFLPRNATCRFLDLLV